MRRYAVLIIAGGLVLLTGATALFIRINADAAWEVMRIRTLELAAEAKARPSNRPVLRGTAEPGNAWTDYEAEVTPGGIDSTTRSTLEEYLDRKPGADAQAVERLVAGHALDIEAFRRGTRRAEGGFAYDWDRGTQLKLPDYIRFQDLVWLTVAKARLQKESGRPGEAAELLLDTAQACGDFRRNSTYLSELSGIRYMFVAYDDLLELLKSKSLSAQDLAKVELELEILDLNWSDFGISLRNEAIFAQFHLLTGDRLAEVNPPFLGSWRYAFSQDLMVADASSWILLCVNVAVQLESKPWPEHLKEAETLRREMDKGRNPLAHYVNYGNPWASSRVRHRRSQLRMLRVATRYWLDGSVTELPDPFGDKLRTIRTNTGLKVWSVGGDGIDNGGIGGWYLSDQVPDIVLEISK